MKKNKKKKAFTLVELLAVIVILAIILVIAVPQITKTIKASRLGAIESSAKLIASNAEDYYLAQQTINPEYSASSIPCTDVAKLSDDYDSCSVKYDASGKATVKLKGAAGGKFANIKCSGTKDNMNCIEKVSLPGYSDAVELLTSKIGQGGLIKDDHNDLRYQGSNPSNYVRFNCTDNTNPTASTCEIWRIIGVFGDRVKLVKKDPIGYFSWDTSVYDINYGDGINQWGPSGTYPGADLMRELNGDYLNSSLSTNANWYNGSGNAIGSENFNRSCVLKESAQELIGDAVWYLGGIPYNTTITFEDAYTYERGIIHVNNPTDGVVRTDTWTGKIGLIYSSDFGYALEDEHSNLYSCESNWMSNYGWTISSAITGERGVFNISTNSVDPYVAGYSNGVHPAVYLISGIQMKPFNPNDTANAPGSQNNPYVFAE